jgi:hypothetical protein
VDRLSFVLAERASDPSFKGKALAIVRKKMAVTVNSGEELPEIVVSRLQLKFQKS